jgi:hypothetical protein
MDLADLKPVWQKTATLCKIRAQQLHSFRKLVIFCRVIVASNMLKQGMAAGTSNPVSAA